ncbi:MAG: hypothetical protein IH991_22865 [Planctomycetes bacterium]|nr:hypothetical protein [Planctomycetota bacterium]
MSDPARFATVLAIRRLVSMVREHGIVIPAALCRLAPGNVENAHHLLFKNAARVRWWDLD